MKGWIGMVALFGLSATSATADEPRLVPKGAPPMFLAAQVGGKEGDQVTFTKYVSCLDEVEKDGKKVLEPHTLSVSAPPKAIGKDIRAFGVDGKPMETAALAKLLANETPVAVFYTNPANPTGAPDLYYRRLFKEGTVVFVVPCDPFEEPGTPPRKSAKAQPKK